VVVLAYKSRKKELWIIGPHLAESLTMLSLFHLAISYVYSDVT